MSSLVEQMQREGLKVDNVKTYGVVFGEIEQSLIPTIRRIEGIQDVREETYDQYIPDPDSDIQ